MAEVLAQRTTEGETFDMDVGEWCQFAARSSLVAARRKARSLGIDIYWESGVVRTPEGYAQIRGGIEYAIAKSLAVAPFCDLLWMETKTANLEEAKEFAEAIHARFPEKMLAYNLSPSFNWDTTGMSDEEMRRFPEELGKLGYVFNFITYGGHQVDGLAARSSRRRCSRTACSPWRACNGSCASSSRPTRLRRVWSEALAPMVP